MDQSKDIFRDAASRLRDELKQNAWPLVELMRDTEAMRRELFSVQPDLASPADTIRLRQMINALIETASGAIDSYNAQIESTIELFEKLADGGDTPASGS